MHIVRRDALPLEGMFVRRGFARVCLFSVSLAFRRFLFVGSFSLARACLVFLRPDSPDQPSSESAR